jgi:hypothetical protein
LSQMCILSSASIFMFLSPRQFRSLVRMLPKTLKSLLQDAMLAETESMRLARQMKSGGSWSGKQKSLYKAMGSGD